MTDVSDYMTNKMKIMSLPIQDLKDVQRAMSCFGEIQENLYEIDSKLVPIQVCTWCCINLICYVFNKLYVLIFTILSNLSLKYTLKVIKKSLPWIFIILNVQKCVIFFFYICVEGLTIDNVIYFLTN